MCGLVFKRSLFTLTLQYSYILFYYNFNYTVLAYNPLPNSNNKIVEQASVNLNVQLGL
jgi:hypothetical protein